MNILFKGIAASLMGVLMTGTAAQGGEIAVIETTMGNIELKYGDRCIEKHEDGHRRCRGGEEETGV